MIWRRNSTVKYAAWLHISLAVYIWLVASIPLGNWNRQAGDRLLIALFKGQSIGADDIFLLVFVSAPAILFCIAYFRRNYLFAALALVFDAVWLWLQIKSWWIPYLFGTDVKWQIDYARGPTTKVLPSFGNHVAPDGMHFVMHLLLVAAMVTGILAFRRLLMARFHKGPDPLTVPES